MNIFLLFKIIILISLNYVYLADTDEEDTDKKDTPVDIIDVDLQEDGDLRSRNSSDTGVSQFMNYYF